MVLHRARGVDPNEGCPLQPIVANRDAAGHDCEKARGLLPCSLGGPGIAILEENLRRHGFHWNVDGRLQR